MAVIEVSAEPGPPPTVPTGSDRGVTAGVVAVWAACSLRATGLVVRSGRSLPYSDDWQLWPFVSGQREVNAGWLWEQHNEHRIPLVKAVHVVVLRAFDYDYRAPILVNVAALSFLALALLLVARRLRGRTRLSDVAIPLLMLAPHLPPLQWGFQLQFTATALALGLVLLPALEDRAPPGSRSLVLWSVAVALLATSGVNGVVVVPVLVVGLVMWAWGARQAARGFSTAATAVAVAGAIAVGGYFVGLESTVNGWGRPGPYELISTSVRLVAAPLGPAVEAYWPLGGMLVLAAVGITARALVRRRLRPPVPVLSVLAAGVVLAGAVGMGRGGRPWDLGISNHYAPLFLPVVVALFLVWAPRGDRLSRLILGAVAVLTLATYVDAVRDATGVGDRTRAAQERFYDDARAGVAPAELVERHIRLLYFVDNRVSREIVEPQVGDYLCAARLRTCP